MVLAPPSLPPPISPPSSLSSANLPARISLFPPLSSSPSVCLYPPSARMTDLMAAGVSPSVPTFDGLPPRPMQLVVLGLGVGGGAQETAPPVMDLSSLTRRQASSNVWVFLVSGPGRHSWIRRYVLEQLRCSTPFHPRSVASPAQNSGCPARVYARKSFCHSWSLVGFCGACLSSAPPSPFPRTTVRVPIPSLPTEEYFCGRPARPHPAGLPCPGLPDGLESSRALFRVPPPYPFHRHACPGLVAPSL